MQKQDLRVHSEVKDFLISGESFVLRYDEERDMLITDPQPPTSDLPKYYESEDYISHTDSRKGTMAFLYQKVKKRALRKKLNLIKKCNGVPGTLLDIGAGTGDFCSEAKKDNWIVEGVEPNSKARDFAKSKSILLQESLDDFRGEQFDVVTLWHVLEHLPDLEKSISQISALVKPKGTLIIAVPNYKSFDANYYKSFWAAFDVPRHLWHFSKKSMPILFGKHFKMTTIKPMIFDSFYVSLLSEKYKTGNTFSIKALFVGLWSNLSAMQTKEYCSHIYCFQKG